MAPRYERSPVGPGGTLLTTFDSTRITGELDDQPAGTVSNAEVWERIRYFYERIVPVAEESKVRLATLPDDPPLACYRGVEQALIGFEAFKKFIGFWVEFGMAAEPSAFGARMHFYPDRPPAIEPLHPDLAFWAGAKPANPLEDGLMPLALRLYRQMDEHLSAEGTPIRMVAARGPLAVASWLTGIPGLMEGLVLQPELVSKILETVTTTLIDWLQAQLECLRHPEGILLLDDLVGMVSPHTYKSMVAPHLERIFAAFDGLLRIYHNDTPCKHLLAPLAEAGFDVFNFSHEVDIAEVKAKMGHRVALLGNVAPLDQGVRGTPEAVYAAATACLDKAAPGGGLVLSFGGGVSPETKPENIDALVRAAKEWGGNF